MMNDDNFKFFMWILFDMKQFMFYFFIFSVESVLLEWLYNGLCESVGLLQIIVNRREIMDIFEVLFGLNLCKVLLLLEICFGSRWEGFWFDNFDMDVMICL